MIIDNQKPSKAFQIISWIAIILIIVGEYFKVSHFPGASFLLVIGSFIFACFYIPLYSVERWKHLSSWKSKTAIVIQAFFLFLFAIGFIFKIQHWPGSGPMYLLNNFLIVTIVIPYAIYHLAKSSKSNINRTHAIFLVIYFFTLSIGTLTNSSSGKISIESVLMQGVNTEEALKSASLRNKQLYTSVANIDNQQSSLIVSKTNKLKTITDSTINHIKSLQSYLLSITDDIPQSVADTLSSIHIRNTNNVDMSTRILIGDELKMNKDSNSAFKLKSIIHAYKDSLLSLVQEQNRAIINEGLNLNTENYEGQDGEPLSWELANFNRMPFLYVYNTLTNIEYEIKNAEYQVLTDIINSDNKELNSALFSQIADLNSKFDAVKKQEQITKLQTENEKRMEMLNSKDSELSDSRQIIIYFLLSTLLFLVLIFFIIRSNYLRKQTNKTLKEQKQIIETQKTVVEEKQREILDSIEYALRIQTAILPPQKIVKQYLENSFILYEPKDIVAGDFYWMEAVQLDNVPISQLANETNGNNRQQQIGTLSNCQIILFAACDCTGHGVPGAMVSVVCHNALNRAVREFGLTKPAEILDKTAEIVIENFSKSEENIKDGMDISLACIKYNEQSTKIELQWAGANNPLWIVRNDQQPTSNNQQLEEIKADKQPIGMNEDSKPFTNHTIALNSGDTIYLFTDGFADQFGGETGEKKLTRKRFKEVLLSIQHLSLTEQGIQLDKFITEYRKEVEQIDDILVMGVRV